VTSGLEAIDLRVLELINQKWVNPWFDTFFVWLTDPPHREIYFVAAGLALLAFGRRRGGIAVLTLGIAVLITDQLIAELIKPAIVRERPVFAHPDVVRFLLEKQAHSPSMPSAHAANSFAAAVVLWELRRSLGWMALVFAVLVSYSRPYVGVHYPSDIFVGALLGTAVGVGTIAGRRGIVWLWRRGSGAEPIPPLVHVPDAVTDPAVPPGDPSFRTDDTAAVTDPAVSPGDSSFRTDDTAAVTSGSALDRKPPV
jgi:undecaprenyl-diphosphatase